MTAVTLLQLYPDELGVAGDRGNVMALCCENGVELVVRTVRDGRVTMVGLELEDQRDKLPARRAARRLRRRYLVWSQRSLRAARASLAAMWKRRR